MAATTRPVAVILAALVLLWCMGRVERGDWTPNQPRAAALAASVSAHPAALPSLAGVRFVEKPPLSYCMSGGSMSLFGTNPAAARPPPLCP